MWDCKCTRCVIIYQLCKLHDILTLHSNLIQLAVVPEYNVFLGLTDGEVFFADLETFSIRGHLSRSKGATYFAVDWQKLRGTIL